ncbi:helix-turn-helix domain-containing protein [Streptomyces longwoodensis]|uniref:helix-turn-helix domain-containing protein n=1 Tax=Streptomyces longwoodensis TaxID=68231 RepID=UPI001FE149A2|nr:helix-turn-helix domain-containing protein [Streptomyces longwoodensis]
MKKAYTAGVSLRTLAHGCGRSHGFVHRLLTKGGASPCAHAVTRHPLSSRTLKAGRPVPRAEAGAGAVVVTSSGCRGRRGSRRPFLDGLAGDRRRRVLRRMLMLVMPCVPVLGRRDFVQEVQQRARGGTRRRPNHSDPAGGLGPTTAHRAGSHGRCRSLATGRGRLGGGRTGLRGEPARTPAQW